MFVASSLWYKTRRSFKEGEQPGLFDFALASTLVRPANNFSGTKTQAMDEEARKAYAIKYRDESTLAARASLHQVVTNAHRSENKPMDEELKAKLQASAENTAKKMGIARMDDPDTLRTILKYYSHDVEKKKAALMEFFDQYSIAELEVLEAVITGAPTEVGDQSFVAKSLEWRGIAQSHGTLFLKLLTDMKDRKKNGEAAPTPMDLLSAAFYQLGLKREQQQQSF